MKRLSDVLTSSLDKKLNEHAAVAKAWQHACGDGISFMTTVVKFSDGILTIAVHDQTWLTELNFMKGELTQRMKTYGLAVSSISFYYRMRRVVPDSVKHNKRTMTEKKRNTLTEL